MDGGEHCATHGRIVANALGGVALNPHQCTIIHDGRQCLSARVEGTTLCRVHVQRVEDARVRDEAMVHVRRYLNMVPRMGWRDVARAVHRDAAVGALARDVGLLYYEAMNPRAPLRPFAQYWRWVLEGEHGVAPGDEQQHQPQVQFAIMGIPVVAVGAAPAAGAGAGLRGFVQDGQNVHRQEVSRQTNEAVAKLLAEPDTVKDIERVLAKAWHDLPAGRIPNFSRYLETAMDMNRWYYTATCRGVDDYLYRKLLHGVVSLIARQPIEARIELYARVYEEARDSVGMCCEGHIARLCNVFVGFDDAFKPPVSLGEMLQMKMSAISQRDMSVEDKRAEAVRVFEEYGVPAEERVAWLDAF